MNKWNREGRNIDKGGVLTKPVNRPRCPSPDLLRSDTKFYHSKPSVGVHTCNFNTQGLKQKLQAFKANLGCWGGYPKSHL